MLAKYSNIYIEWMEIGRLKLLETAGIPFHQVKSRGFIPVLTRTEINYRKPVFLGDVVRVVLWISELKRISATLSFQFYNQHDELVADGMQVAVFVSLTEQKPYRLSAEDRSLFRPFVQEAPGSIPTSSAG
jgi:acyl-CoA thioester hydrolase